MKCKSLTQNSRRPCRAHSSRQGGSFCDFHRAAEMERFGKYLAAVNSFSELAEEARIGDDIVLIPPVISAAEAVLENWIPFSDLAALVDQLGIEPVPADGREFSETMLAVAARVVSEAAAMEGRLN